MPWRHWGSGGTRPFAKFMDSLYYSESELRGGAVTVSFPKYIPWQAMNFLQRSTHLSKTCCRLLITSKFLASELPFHGWKSPEIAWGEIWIGFCVRLGEKWIGGTPLEHPPYSPDLVSYDFWAFPTMKRELRGKKFRYDQRFAARFREVGGASYEVHRLLREVLRREGDRHRTSTKFRLGVIRGVHELFKRPSYICTHF
jgi:hypothetical protein